jgi:outer membrane protein
LIMMGRCFLFALLVLTIFFGNGSVQAANVNFAYVDGPRVLAASEARKSARELLRKKLANQKGEVVAVESDINQMKKKLKQRKGSMTAESLSDLTSKIRRRYTELQRLKEDNQAAVDRENRRWTKKLTEALREVIEEVGRKEKYTAIFSTGQVIFADPNIDITDKIILQLNTKTKAWF